MDEPLIFEFVGELKEHIEKIESGLLILETQKDKPDQEIVSQIFRPLHSIKGAAGFMELHNIKKLAHSMESILVPIRDNKQLPNQKIFDHLFSGLDILKKMTADILNSNNMDIDAICTAIINLKLHPEDDGIKSSEKQKNVALGSDSVHQTTINALNGQQDPAQTEFPIDSCDSNSEHPEPIKSEQSDTIRLNVRILDQLLALAGELVLVRNQHLRAVDTTTPLVKGISQRLDQVTTELQETIMQTRLQTIDIIFSRFHRIVRDISQKQEKIIDLTCSGNDVELDKTVIESLTDPLMHIIRNCCDHGLETPLVRTTKGKTSAGKLTVKASHEAGHIQVVVKDDGRGIDPIAIKNKLLTLDRAKAQIYEEMNEKELISCIFKPGLTTCKEISEFSGRGVGMDVANTSIKKIGGTIGVESQLNIGTTFTIEIPLTLAIIPSMAVNVSGQRFAISQHRVEELVCLYDNDIYDKIECLGNQEVYRLRDELIPIVRLSEVLKHNKPFTEEKKLSITNKYSQLKKQVQCAAEHTPDSLHFLITKGGQQKFGLIIDKVIGSEEIVIKPMHSFLQHLPIYSGVTIMGDGEMALILDVDGIAKYYNVDVTNSRSLSRETEEIGISQDVLLFSNNPDEHFALPLLQVKNIKRVAIKQIESIGDKEFLTINGISTLVLRLGNILDLDSPVQNEEMFLVTPRYVKEPVGILINCLSGTRLLPEQFEEKGFLGQSTLGTVILDKQLTSILDIYSLIEQAEPKCLTPERQNLNTSLTPNILLVEKDKLLQRLIKQYFRSAKFKVSIAATVEDAIHLLGKQPFNVIVIDLNLLKNNKNRLVDFIKNGIKEQTIPIFATLPLDVDPDEAKYKEVGFDGYLKKYDRESLINAIIKKINDLESVSAATQMDRDI
nr:hybrid sensor histidine kinase/response regulator [Desulfobulbaceae bacterium]